MHSDLKNKTNWFSGMVGLTKIHFIALLLIFLGIQVDSDPSNHSYIKGDIVPFYANKYGLSANPRETYAYYDLPFCSPDIVKKNELNLGEMMNGDRLVSTPFKLEFLVEKRSEVLCKKRLSKTDVSRFRSAIDKDYYVEYYFDDLPVWAYIGWVNNRDYADEKIKNRYILYTHLYFDILYNNNRVIAVHISVYPNFLNFVTDITKDVEVDVNFTYSVRWSLTTNISFEDRMNAYMFVDRHSFTNSSLTLLILFVFQLTLYMKVIRKDIYTYKMNSQDVEENQVTDNQEETGWKNIHGDVFRFPEHKSLFAAALGSGTHLLVLMISVIVLGLLGSFPPYARGVFWNALVIVYAVTSLVAGYTSVSFYSQLEGTKRMKNLLLTGGLFFAPLFITFGFLNTIAIFYGTTAALPLGGIVILSVLWIFLTSPLLLLGGIIGKNRSSGFQAPCRTAKCPKEVPRLRCILFVDFVLLLITTALVSVALTYFQLAAEYHEWWWRSFCCGGSTGLFIYGYCIYYYFCGSDMTGVMQTSFFFGYRASVCYGLFLTLGSLGFRASLPFVRYLYAAIKCD